MVKKMIYSSLLRIASRNSVTDCLKDDVTESTLFVSSDGAFDRTTPRSLPPKVAEAREVTSRSRLYCGRDRDIRS
jgi:hypothetical protein